MRCSGVEAEDLTCAELDPFAYHFDLRPKSHEAGANLAERLAYLGRITADPASANPVTVIQLALGTLQLRDPEQLPLVSAVVDWLDRSADDDALLAYRFPLPHTFPLEPPWHSSLAQGEAASLLVRAGQALGRKELFELAGRFAEPLLDPESPLVALTEEGPALQEYPTDPPAHVLNGWITSLFGLYDVAQAPGGETATARRAADAFAAGTATLVARLHRYRAALGWSRYDLYPRRLVNPASLAYHRHHIAQLRTLYALTGFETLAMTADEWEHSLRNPAAVAVAVLRKVAFRVVRPRFRRVTAR
jgi:heparosan-N-sulfate-glucuronate 5-epimerase